MANHPAIAPGRAAVVTGAAGGIGLAAALKFAAARHEGDAGGFASRRAGGRPAARRDRRPTGATTCSALPVDVSDAADVVRLRDAAYEAFGEVAVLMNNAGIGGGGPVIGDPAKWRRVLDVNLWGVINGMQAFAPAMIRQGTPGAIVNTGSKQGITTPPGDAAYNVSKAGVKVATEALAHELRNIEGGKVTAHLLIPGFTFTGITADLDGPKPPGAWTADQVADFLLEGMGKGDFYILCPDNEVTRDMDERRILWAAQDIIENRPPLSRWHADWKERFAAFMKRPS